MVKIDLGGTWGLKSGSSNISTTGTVPGEVHGDLLANGLIPDPYYKDNDSKLRWIAWDDWIYTRSFTVTKDVLTQDEILLICYGIDTVSTIKINGNVVGTTDNQFRRYTFKINQFLVENQNTIEVIIMSAGKYTKEKMETYPYPLPESTSQQHSHGELGRNYIRKESCSFAWDWGPCFMPQGIWKPIEIVAFSSTPFLKDLKPQVFNKKDGHFQIRVGADFIVNYAVSGVMTVYIDNVLKQDFSFSLEKGRSSVSHDVYVPEERVELWWPVGYGKQPLYQLNVQFTFNNGDVISQSKRIGFKSFELVQEPYSDREGRSFYFRVNGVPIWSKGSNFIPIDAFESRATNERIRNILQSSLDANMNTIRVWGGGIYQDDYFYDSCDEMGLLVWEEFMFACALYPTNKDFLATVREEVIYQVTKLMHHVSVVLWSGNNENQQAITENWFTESIQNPWLYAIDYERLYHETIRETFLTVDQSKPFISSSPANGVISYEPYTERWRTELGGTSNDQRYGDNHYYNYKSDCEDIYSMVSPRFSSEYGFQSLPSFDAIKKVSEPSDWIWDSPFLKYRNHRTGDGQVEIKDQMILHFQFPSHPNKEQELDKFIYLSQVTQGLCYRAQTEHYRRSKTQGPNTMGALYWQLNDIWQAPTWSSLEYGGKWKLVHYFAKNFFSPLLVSSYRQKNDMYDVHITSDLMSDISGTFTLDIWNWTSQKQNSIVVPFELNSLGSKSVLNKPFNEICKGANQEDCVFALYVTAQSKDGQVHESKNFFFPSKPKNIKSIPFPDIITSSFSQNSNTFTFTVSSKTLAPFLFLDTSYKGRFSDNSVLLVPNTPLTFTFYAWESITLQQFINSLRIRSLYDARPE